MSDTGKVDRQLTTPFLLRLFYKNGNFHRLDEFASSRLPPHLQIYTWPTCSLSELTHLLLSALPSLLPHQYAGTRIAFRLVYADAQGPSRPGATPRYISRDLGSVVVGAAPYDPDEDHQNQDKDKDTEMGDANADAANVKDALKQLKGELEKTLSDAKFMIGDYVSAAILPPGADGIPVAAPPPPTGPSSRAPQMRDGYGGRGGRENGFGGRGDFGFGGRGGGRGGRYDDRRGGGVPSGEWRRGDVPPERERDRDGPWTRGGGGGGGRGRGRGRW